MFTALPRDRTNDLSQDLLEMLTGSDRDAAVHQRMEEERSHQAQLEEERRY